jgi:hypothetical protein
MPLDFVETTVDIEPMDQPAVSANELISEVARDYQLQMQAYALAVRQLLPSWSGNLKVTLHFLEPNIEFRLPDDLLEAEVCARAIDQAMEQIVSSLEPEHFPVKPAQHCRMCSFVGICPAGLRQVSRSNFL